MARQKGVIKLQGKIGDLSFYKTQDGYLAREKGGVDKARIESDPAFQRTRENGQEFGRAGSAGRLLRTSVRPLLLRAADKRVTARIMREMVKIVKSDSTNIRGERVAVNGNFQILQGFEFNTNGRLAATMYAPFTSSIDRASGVAEVQVPGFVPQNSFSAPLGATHMRLISAGSAVNFTDGTFTLRTSESGMIVIGPQSEAALTLTNNLPAGSTDKLFLLLGVEFFQEVNGAMYPLKNGAYNCLSLIKID